MFCVKILKFFDVDTGYGIETLRSGIEKNSVADP
jgi:hypothetical protein